MPNNKFYDFAFELQYSGFFIIFSVVDCNGNLLLYICRKEKIKWKNDKFLDSHFQSFSDLLNIKVEVQWTHV